MNLFISNSKAYIYTLILCFFFVFCASLLITEVWIREHVLANDPFVGYKNLFINGTAKTVAFGDSHVASGLASISSIDNLGQPADNLTTVIQKLNLRIARGGVSQVILQADPHIFSAYRIRIEDQGRIENLLRQKNSPLAILRPEYRQFLSKFWLAAISNIFSQNSLPPEKDGYIPTFDKWDKERAHSITLVRVQMHSPVSNFSSLKLASDYVETIAKLKKQNIKVCLVGFPLSSEYRRSELITPSFLSARNFFAKTGRDLQVPYINYESAIPDNGFVDSDHLHPDFAINFTQRVMHDCFFGR